MKAFADDKSHWTEKNRGLELQKLLFTTIFSSTVFEENLRCCYSLSVVVDVQELWHFVISQKFGVCVHYPKSNAYYHGRQLKMHFISRIMTLSRLGKKKTSTFCNISVITVDIDLKLRVCVYYPKSNPYYQGRRFKMHLSRIMPLFRLRKCLTFCNISVITEDIDLKLGVYVHCQKSNPYYQGRQFRFLSELCPLFSLRIFILYRHPTYERWHPN